MRILDMQLSAWRGGGTMAHVASFDVELNDDVRMYGLKLMEAPDGKRITVAPSAHGGRRAATFARSLAERITAAANTTYLELDTAHGNARRIA